MEQIPKADLLNTLSLFTIHLNWEDHILSSRDQHHPLILYYCSVLGLSLTAFHMAISNLHSVLNVHKSQSGMPLDFSFYHKSFIDFLSTSTRSGPKYCINMPECLQNCFKAIINFLCRISNTNNGKCSISLDWNVAHFLLVYAASILAWPDIDTDVDNVCQAALRNFFALGSREGIEMTEEILQLLSQINWRQLIVSITYVPTARVKTFNANVCYSATTYNKWLIETTPRYPQIGAPESFTHPELQTPHDGHFRTSSGDFVWGANPSKWTTSLELGAIGLCWFRVPEVTMYSAVQNLNIMPSRSTYLP